MNQNLKRKEKKNCINFIWMNHQPCYCKTWNVLRLKWKLSVNVLQWYLCWMLRQYSFESFSWLLIWCNFLKKLLKCTGFWFSNKKPDLFPRRIRRKFLPNLVFCYFHLKKIYETLVTMLNLQLFSSTSKLYFQKWWKLRFIIN